MVCTKENKPREASAKRRPMLEISASVRLPVDTRPYNEASKMHHPELVYKRICYKNGFTYLVNIVEVRYVNYVECDPCDQRTLHAVS